MNGKWYIVEEYFDMGMTESIINLTDAEINVIKKFINREFIYEDMYAPTVRFFDDKPYPTREDALHALGIVFTDQANNH